MQSSLKKPPFPSLVKTTLAKGAQVPDGYGPKPLNPDDIEITDEPVQKSRPVTGGKYQTLFQKLKPGQCLKVPPPHVGSIQNALRKYLKQNQIELPVRTVKNYGDGLGRVWLIELPKKLKAVA